MQSVFPAGRWVLEVHSTSGLGQDSLGKNLEGALMCRKTCEGHFLQSDWREEQHTCCLRSSMKPPRRRTHGIFLYTKAPRPHFQGQSRSMCCLGYGKGSNHPNTGMLNLSYETVLCFHRTCSILCGWRKTSTLGVSVVSV